MKWLASAVFGVLTLAVMMGTSPVRAALAPPITEADIATWNGMTMEPCDGDVVRDYYLLLAWSEDRGAGQRIMAKRVRTNGLPIGGPDGEAYELTRPTGPYGQKGEQRWPALLEPERRADTPVQITNRPEHVGGLVVWSEMAPGASDYDIYGQRLFGNGLPAGKPALLVGGPADQVQPAVVGLREDDEMLLVWSDNDDDAGDIWGQRVTRTLIPRGRPFPMIQGPGTATDPSIAADLTEPDSGYLLVWTDDRNGNLDIYEARLAQNGLPRGGRSGHIALVESLENDYAPDLIIDSEQRNPQALVLWTHDNPADGADVLGQRLRINGRIEGLPFLVTGGPDDQLGPAMTENRGHAATRECNCLRDGGWTAIWIADRAADIAIESMEIGMNGRPMLPVRLLQTVY